MIDNLLIMEPNSFLNRHCPYDQSGIVLVPICIHDTDDIISVTEAIIDHSRQLTTFDSEIQKEISNIDIFQASPILLPSKPAQDSPLQQYIQDGKFLICLHSSDHYMSRIFHPFYLTCSPLAYIQLSAKLNMQNSNANNHNTLFQCAQISPHVFTAGARSFSQDELKLIQKSNIPYLTDKALYTYDYELKKILESFPHLIYLTINLDFFSPSIIPSPQNLIRGGPHWWQGLLFIRELFQRRSILSLSITGLSPKLPDISLSTVAQLIFKLIAYQIYVSKHEFDIDIITPPFYTTN